MKERILTADHENDGTIDLITQSLESGKAYLDNGKQKWNTLVDQILNKNGQVIVLRGAGSVNGSDQTEADLLLEKELIPRIEEAIRTHGNVVILYDGDPDTLDRPDIGYFAGRLLDRFGNDLNKVIFITAQKRSWYYPTTEGANLVNAHDQQFVTYVFEDGVYTEDHNSFTQDSRLVESKNYEQWYIGASGDIATSQIKDFDQKVPDNQKRKAVLFRVKNNSSLDSEIENKLKTAIEAADEKKIAKFQKQLEQRKNIYGSHWNNDGPMNIDTSKFPKLELSFVVSV